MNIDWVQIFLTITTLLFGGSNIVQLVNNRQLRRKLSAESDQARNATLLQIINGQTEEISRLQNAYGQLQEKYFALAEELQDIRTRMTNTKKKSTK